MGKAHSVDLRVRVYGEVAKGHSRRAAARRFGVSASTGVRLARRMTETGSLAPARQGRPPGGGKLAAWRATLIGWVEAQDDITMPELAARLASEHGVVAHPASLSRLLRLAGLPSKKTLLASEAERADVVRRREVWQVHRQPWMLKRPHRLVFIDETGTTPVLSACLGRQSKGRK